MERDNILIKLDHVSKCFGKGDGRINALSEISFDLAKGESIGFLGPNGAGKTTTIRAILGLLKPDSGEIIVSSKTIGFVLDMPSLYPQLSLEDNFLFYSDLLRISREETMEKIEMVGLSENLKQKVETFSLGMKKRAEIARALCKNPDVLLLDEPFTGLDPEVQSRVRNILKYLSDSGVSMIVTSHDLYNVQQLSSRYIFIKKGKIVKIMSAEKIETGKELEKEYRQIMSV